MPTTTRRQHGSVSFGSVVSRHRADRFVRSMPQGAPDLKALPLHAGLTTEMQMAVFEPPPPRTRKVIVSTNVAEASVTIDGIKYVVDSGLVKVRYFRPYMHTGALLISLMS